MFLDKKASANITDAFYVNIKNQIIFLLQPYDDQRVKL
jgi:hypothetical protein